MKKTLVIISLVFGLGACDQGNRYVAAPGAVPDHVAVPNEFMVKGDKGVVEAELKSMGVKYQITSYFPRLNLHHVRYEGNKSYTDVASRIAPQVQLIEQNSKVSINAVESKMEWPEDKFYFYQWAMNNIGQSAPGSLPGEYDADTKVLQALKKYGAGLQEDTIIAVIDTGVNYKHDDLNKNMWVNAKESAKGQGVAGRDDDENGYCDDVHGYDFTRAGRTKPHCGQIGDEDPMDEMGHGTHCAGSIAAVANNGIGIAGMNPRAKIMALRAFDNFGGNNYDIQRAIGYAMENGANIISASYGGSEESPITKDLIRDAGEKGILFVAAAGNDGQNMEIKDNRKYPAAYQLPSLLTVAASDNMDNSATFTNYGANFVDVYAPGVSILSLYVGQDYVPMDGTSMATPIVAGIASLLMSVYPELKKDPVRVKEIIMATVDRRPAMYGKVKSNGRVNALAALDRAQSAIQVPPIVWQEEAVSVSQTGFNTELVDIRKKVVKQGAKAIRVHFDFLEIDRSFDSVYIYDKNLKLVTELTNGSSRDLWSPVIVGDTAIIRFVNAKVKEESGATQVAMNNTEQAKCQQAGGEVLGPVPTSNIGIGEPMTQFYCLQDNLEYRYEDLKKDINKDGVFFSWQSEGFSIDAIEFTENEI